MDNQAPLLAAWFLRGFPEEKIDTKHLIYMELNRQVSRPLSPQPNEKPSLLGFFIFMQSQALLERVHINKKTKTALAVWFFIWLAAHPLRDHERSE